MYNRILILLTFLFLFSGCAFLQNDQCTSVWSCTEWTECINDSQSRSCADKNACRIASDVPELIRNCDSGDTCAFTCCSDRACDDANLATTDFCGEAGTAAAYCYHGSHPVVSGFYDYCWEYNCSSSMIPYPKLTDSAIPDFAVMVNHAVNATGAVRIAVIPVYVDEPMPSSKFDEMQLNEEDENSLLFATKWWRDQAAEYNVNFDLNITILDQIKLPGQYRVEATGDRSNYRYTKYVFETHPELLDFDVFAFIYYGSYQFEYINQKVSDATIIMYIQETEPGRFEPSEGRDLARTFVHELSHVFGATDKYSCMDVSSQSCAYAKQNGVGCIVVSGQAEMAGYDIMCHRVAERGAGDSWGFIQPNVEELQVSEITAKEIGWLDVDKDGFIDVEDPCPFDSTNKRCS